MLRYLAENSRLPVPGVLHVEADLLLTEFIATAGGLAAPAQEHAAQHLAALHGIGGPSYGFAWDTAIGGLPQPNRPSPSWLEFFRDRRLMHMGRAALDAGQMPAELHGRLEAIAARLDRWIGANMTPCLIHGDMWTGNILCRAGRIAAFVDPAIYFADPEIELAFATLFGTFGDDFFRRYRELRPIAPGFFEERRDLYNLYPLLVHARLFGGSYVAQIDRTLRKFGF
jgi:fructosamine-3-kinase